MEMMNRKIYKGQLLETLLAMPGATSSLPRQIRIVKPRVRRLPSTMEDLMGMNKMDISGLIIEIEPKVLPQILD